ncbi:hypothetical protein STEG23_032438 [Scotinomys teguina]
MHTASRPTETGGTAAAQEKACTPHPDPQRLVGQQRPKRKHAHRIPTHRGWWDSSGPRGSMHTASRPTETGGTAAAQEKACTPHPDPQRLVGQQRPKQSANKPLSPQK